MDGAFTSRPGLTGRILRIGVHAAPLVVFSALLGKTLGDRLSMESYFLKWSYYFILALTAWWAASGWRYLRSRKFSPAAFLKAYWPGLVIALAMTLSVASSVPMEFKTLSDETNLVSVSKSMLEGKTCRNVTMSKNYYGQPHTVSYAVPKRPLVFPFLIQLVHLVRGYDYRNAFYLNLAVLFLLLAGIYILFARLADTTTAVAAMLLVLSTPLVPILATSAGFDLINSVFLLFILVLAYHHLAQGDGPSFSFLWLSLLVFANIRYESLFFGLLIVLLLAVTKKIKPAHIRACSLELCATVLILLPTLWQRIVTLKSTTAGDGATFSMAYLLSHGQELLKSLANFSFGLPYENMLTAVSLPIYAYLLWWHVKNRRRLGTAHKTTAMIFAVVVVLNALFYLSYYWGRYDHPSSARFFVFLSLVTALGPVWLRYFKPAWLPSRLLLGLATVSLVLYYPVAINSPFMDTLTLNRLTRHALAYLEPYAKEDVMAVTIRPGQMVAAGYGAVNFRYAGRNGFGREVRRHLYPHVVVFQKISYADNLPAPDTRLDMGLPLVTRQEMQVTSRYYLRISEVIHAAEGPNGPTPPGARQTDNTPLPAKRR